MDSGIQGLFSAYSQLCFIFQVFYTIDKYFLYHQEKKSLPVDKKRESDTHIK